MSQKEKCLKIDCPGDGRYKVFLDEEEITQDIFGLDLRLRFDGCPEATLYYRAYPVEVQGKLQVKTVLRGE